MSASHRDKQPSLISNEQIGKVIKLARKKAGMRQTTLAEIIGLDQSAMSRVENGQQAVLARQWFHLCAIFEIPSGAHYVERVSRLADK